MNALSAEAKLAIHELLARSAWAYDEKRMDVMAECFAAEARMSLRIGGGDVIGPYEGRSAVLELIRGSLDAQNDQRRHVIANVFFESETTTSATVISTLTLLATAHGAISVLSAGLYRDDVVLEPGGWRFRARFLTLDRPY